MNIDKKALKGFITEIEASRDRAKGETTHQSEIFKKAKSVGFDTKAMRKVLQRRAMTPSDLEALDGAIDSYEHALGDKRAAAEAMEAGMSAREAAAAHNLPRAAVNVLKRGTKNAISDPEARAILSPPEASELPSGTPARPVERDPATGEVTEGQPPQEAGEADEQPDNRGVESRPLPEVGRCGASSVGEGDAELHECGGSIGTAGRGDVPALSPPLGPVPTAGAAAETPPAQSEAENPGTNGSRVVGDETVTPAAPEPSEDELRAGLSADSGGPYPVSSRRSRDAQQVSVDPLTTLNCARVQSTPPQPVHSKPTDAAPQDIDLTIPAFMRRVAVPA